MKNLKRAFSLALALVMLVGMMLMPASAGTFADEDKIVNKEAVAITAGMGLFAGSNGNFMPEGTVTRAQMATIIVKMLNGSDVNADSFKGSGKFSDTADFEGGWAEGYINWCSTLGVVAGYGDGTFKPGKAVTAAEAVTMILNALKVDAGQGTWPVTVMAKAEEIKLFDDLATKPGNDVVLNRDQLSVVVLNGLNYSAEGITSYKVGDKKFDSAMDAFLYAESVGGTVDTVSGSDSLAGAVYEMKTATGIIVGNQQTGLDYTQLSDGKQFDIETGLEDIGHYVTVYYKEVYESDEKPGTTYAVVDEATYITVAEDVDTAKEFKAAFGKNYTVAASGWVVDGNHVPTYEQTLVLDGYVSGQEAVEGTYVVFEGKITGYIAPAEVYAARVTMVGKTLDREYIMLSGVVGQISNTEGDDMVVEYDGIAVDDMITYVKAQGIYVLTKMETVTGELTRHSNDEHGCIVVTVGGKQYTDFGEANNAFAADVSVNTLISDIEDVNYGQSYTFYLAPNGKVVCYEEVEGVAFNVEETVYLLGSISTVEMDKYGAYNKNTYARGIDMQGDEVMVLLGTTRNTDKRGNGGTETVGSTQDVKAGFYTVKASTVKEEKEYGIQLLTAFNTNSRSDKPYAMSYTSGSGWNFTGKLTSGGKTYNKTGNTHFLTLDNAELTDAKEFAASLSVGSCSVWLAEGQRMDCIVSAQTNGTLMMEVCIIHTQSETAASEMVYVSQYANTTTGRLENGYVYKAYNAKNGDERELMLDEDVTLEPGFYTVSTGADGVNTLTFMPAYTGSNADTEDNADGFYYYNVFYDSTLSAFDGSTIWTDGLVNNKSCSAAVAVVDARDEKQIVEDGVPQITSLNDIIAMWISQPEVSVSLDICYYSGGNRVSAIFVRGVGEATINAADLGAVVYITSDPRNGAVEGTVVAVSGDRKATLSVGDVIEFAPEQIVLQDCSGSCWDNSKCNGFFSIEGASLESVKLKHQRSLDSKGVFADHNIVTGWSDDDRVATFDIHQKLDDCGYYCYSNSKLTYTEASFYLDLSGDVDVIDMVDGQITTLAELKQAVQASLAAPATDNGIVISYYIPDAGDAPQAIVVYAKNANLTRPDNASQKLWQAWPGQVVYLPNGRSVGSQTTEMDGSTFSRRGATAWSMDGSEHGYLMSTVAYITEASKTGFYLVDQLDGKSYVSVTYLPTEEQTTDNFADVAGADTYFKGDDVLTESEVEDLFLSYSSVNYLTYTAEGVTAVVILSAEGQRGEASLLDAGGTTIASGEFAAMVVQAEDGQTVVLNDNITIADRITLSGKSVTVSDGGTARTITVTSGSRAFSIDADAELIIAADAGMTFEGGQSGSVAIMVNGDLTVEGDVTFRNFVCDNTNDTTGGSVIYVAGTGSVTLDGVTFSGNSTAKAGGAIYSNGTLTITDGAFTGNSSTNSGGAVYTSGTLEVDGTTFTDNSNPGTANKYGGAIQINGGTAILKDVTASGNKAYRGYDVYGASTANITLDGGSFTSGGDSTGSAALYFGANNTLTMGGKLKGIINFQSTGAITVMSDFSIQSDVNIWLAGYTKGRVLLSGDAAAVSAAVTAGAITSTRAVEQGFTLGTDGKLNK